MYTSAALRSLSVWVLLVLWCLLGGDGFRSRPFSAHIGPWRSKRAIESAIWESIVESDVSTLPSENILADIEVAGKKSAKKASTNVGRKHTEASKAKIAQANKGKKPWNVGKKHSEETKARIAERTRVAMAKRKQDKLDAMGMTLEEYNESREKKIKEKRRAKAKGGLTPEGRKRISESVKKRWEDPAYRERYSLANKGNRNHSEETKAKISAAIKAKWEDQEYRAKVNTSSHRPSAEVRSRISKTLKKKWQDPDFRQKMLKNTHERNDEWKGKVSSRIRELWKDPNYRSNVQQGIIASSSSRTVRLEGAKQRRRTSSKAKSKVTSKKATRRSSVAGVMGTSKAGENSSGQKGGQKGAQSSSLSGAGVVLSTESSENPSLLADGLEMDLQARDVEMALLTDEEAASAGAGEDKGHLDEDEEEDDYDDDYDDYDMEEVVQEDHEDVIEVYDESGTLVGTYTDAEWAQLKKNERSR